MSTTTTNTDKAAFIQDFYAKLVLQSIAGDRFNLKPTKPQLQAALDAANDAADLLFDPPLPKRQTKQFMVAASSDNRNSFGLQGIVLVARDGEAWEIGINSMISSGFKTGSILTLGLDVFGMPEFGSGVEIPRKLPTPPRGVIEELWGKNAVTT